MKQLSLIFSFALLWSVAASALPNPVIVYQSENGEALVEYPANLEIFPSGNRVFYLKNHDQYQLQLSWENASGEETVFDFERSKVGSSEGEINIAKNKARVVCENKRTPSFKKLEGAQLKYFVTALNSGSAKTHWLPTLEQSSYLFQSTQVKDYVLITADHFNFYGNYQIYIGKPGHWKKQEVENDPKKLKAAPEGIISFKTGGGIYIPLQIHLFSDLNKGAPSLIRERNAPVEDLVAPHLPLKAIHQILENPKLPNLTTPCDS